MKKGFTFVELLVVIILIGLLCSLFIPALQKAREEARKIREAKIHTLVDVIVTDFRTEVRIVNPGSSCAAGKTFYLLKLSGQAKVFVCDSSIGPDVAFLKIGDVIKSVTYKDGEKECEITEIVFQKPAEK